MQQTKSYWRLVAVAGVVSAFVASACVVTTTDDTSSGGSSSGGASAGTAGTASAGTAGASAGSAGAISAGSGGAAAVEYQCDADAGAPGTPLSCTDLEGPMTACSTCLSAKCCTEFSECYAYNPGNQCGYGGPNDGGEFECMHDCAQKAFVDQGTVGQEEIDACTAKCTTTKAHGSTKDCGGLPGGSTSVIVGCMLDNCKADCVGE